jgi:CheY-like chemotaxis protein
MDRTARHLSLARIMLVDDDNDCSIVMKRGLEVAGFHVEAFCNPLQALERFKPNEFDMLILDVRMPEMDGFALYEIIRKIDGKAKVCFLTAFDMEYREEFQKKYPTMETKCFLEKPVSLQALIKIAKAELNLA